MTSFRPVVARLRRYRAVVVVLIAGGVYAAGGGLAAVVTAAVLAVLADVGLEAWTDRPAGSASPSATTEATSDAAPSPLDVRPLEADPIREALDRLPGIFYVLGPSQRLRHWNARFEEVSGYPAEELSGAEPHIFFEGDDIGRVHDAIQRVYDTGTAQVEADFVRKDGRTIPMLFSGDRIELGGQPCLVGMGLDISERKEREEKLEDSRRRLKEKKDALEHSRRLLAKTAEVAGVGGFVLNPKEGRIDWTQQMRALLDVPADYEPRPGREWAFVPEESRDEVRDKIRHALATGESISAEMPIVTARGERRWTWVSAETERVDPEGERRLWGVVQDVTETKRLRRLLEETERIAELGGWAYDPVDDRMLWTDHLAEMLPLPDSRDFSFDKVDFLADEDRRELLRAGVRSICSGKDFEMEIPATVDGETRWLYLRCYAEPTGTGRHRLWGLAQDVTRRKRHEQRLEQAKREAERAERLKTAFLANFSHEVRTPLTSMMGFAEILEDEVEGPHADFAQRVRRSGERLKETVNGVLHLSRLEAEGLDLPDEPVDLGTVAEKAASMMEQQAEIHEIDLDVDIAEGVVGPWPEVALNRILDNLLDNAIQYTPAGGHVQLRVGTDTAPVGWVEDDGAETSCGVLVVEDDGPGIPDAYRDDLFEPFSRGPDQADEKGTGLGLSIVHRFVQALNGDIQVDSEEGRGTRFTVRLPMSLPAPSESGPRVRPGRRGNGKPR